MTEKVTPPKVLHIVENLNTGAVETWLVRMLAHGKARGEDLDWTFYCALGQPGAMDDKARGLGARIVYSPQPLAQTATFVRALRDEMKRGGYDVVHAHHDLISGLYMAASTGLPIRRRLLHIHNADEHLPTSSRLKYALLREPMRRLGLSADRVIGISQHTLDTFLHGRTRRPGRDLVHYYGVDPAAFSVPKLDRVAFRRSIGLADDAIIMLFGGRLTPEKNPVFTVDVLAALRETLPGAVAVFAGAGSMEDAVVERARALHVDHAVRVLGWRSDLPDIMNVSDLFILPRPEAPMEGFGLAVVEAQLAGLRMLLSRGVPDDPLLPNAQFRRLSLSQPAQAWGQAAAELLASPAPSPEAMMEALAASPMNLNTALDALRALHE